MLAALALAPMGASAETVFVKYHGEVDLKGFNCVEQPSSLVWRTCWKLSDRYLLVNLKGTWYHYCRMPPETVAAWRSSPSLGRYYLANIKGNYDCRQGGTPSQ
jgi:hypothetical protein